MLFSVGHKYSTECSVVSVQHVFSVVYLHCSLLQHSYISGGCASSGNYVLHCSGMVLHVIHFVDVSKTFLGEDLDQLFKYCVSHTKVIC